MDLRTLSAVQLADRIRTGAVTSRAVVDAHIAQIERVNPTLNAVVKERFAEARTEADAADRKLADVGASRVPPLHGVPCSIKECFAFTGMPNSSGLVRRKHVIADTDATTVARLRAAGAIPLGVTNTSELCMWMESDNRVYGRSNNAYDQTRIVGGSSGGEGAIVSAGGTPFGLGSDIGGSIRGPAFFNGVFGHKPSAGLVPNTGQYPVAHNDARRMLTTGPIARRAEDLMPVLRILAGPDGRDAVCESMPLGDPATVDLRGRTLLDIADNGRLSVSDDLCRAREDAVRALERRGMRVKHVKLPRLRYQFDIWSAVMALATDQPFGTMLGEGTPISELRELVKYAFGRSDHMLMSLVVAITDPVPRLFPAQSKKLAEVGRKLRAEVLELMGDDGIWIYPPYTTAAPRHGKAVREALTLRYPFAYFGIMNVLELPATQVPTGLNAKGLPLGVQVASRGGNDHVCIAVALELEKELGGWVPPGMAGIG